MSGFKDLTVPNQFTLYAKQFIGSGSTGGTGTIGPTGPTPPLRKLYQRKFFKSLCHTLF